MTGSCCNLREVRCPGCNRVRDAHGLCFACEYDNLVSGRSHYCGKRSCHCWNLRRFMKVGTLETFIPQDADQR